MFFIETKTLPPPPPPQKKKKKKKVPTLASLRAFNTIVEYLSNKYK